MDKPTLKNWLPESEGGSATEEVLLANVAGMTVMQLMLAAADGQGGQPTKYHESVPGAAVARLVLEFDRGKSLLPEYVGRAPQEVQDYVASLKASEPAKPGKAPKPPKAEKPAKEPKAPKEPKVPKEPKAKKDRVMGAPKVVKEGEGEAAVVILDSTANWDNDSKAYAIIPGEGSRVIAEASPKQRADLGGARTFTGTVTARFEKNHNGHWITIKPDEGLPIATAWKSMFMVQVTELQNGFDPRPLPFKEDAVKATPKPPVFEAPATEVPANGPEVPSSEAPMEVPENGENTEQN